MGTTIEVDVLGPLRIAVDGVAVEPPAQVAPLLVALAVPPEPIRKLDLAREVLFLSPGSIDSRLSRLHRLLGVDVPVHRVPVARSGLVELDRGSVRVDADLFRALVAEADKMVESGHRAEALRVLLLADGLWRNGPYAWDGLGDQDGRTAFGQARDELLDRRRRVRTVAAGLAREHPDVLPLTRLVQWTHDGEATPAVWNARVVRELDTGGPTAARVAVAEWPADEANERARRWATLIVEEQPAPGYPSAPGVTHPAGRLTPPVGREHEFTELWRFTQRVADGRGGVHLLIGGSGTGKTHLLGDLRRHASEQLGLPIIAIDVEENTGVHQVLRQGLSPLWHDLLRRPDPPDEVVGRADEIAAFIRGPTLDGPKGVSGREPIAPAHHAAGLAGAVLRAVERPMLLVLDNVHRATRELLDVMRVLGRDSLGVVGVVASLRPDGCWGRLRVDDDPAVTLLEPFDLAAARRFLSSIRRRPVDEREVQCLYRQAGGTPLALLNASDDVEVVAPSRSAPSVMSTLGRWLESRPPAVRRALAVAAVLAEGTRFDLTLLEQILDNERDALCALAKELDKGIEVHRVDGDAAFTHRAWQEAAYTAIEPHRRRALHQRVLELLERQLVQSSDPVELASCAAAIAHHAGRAEGGGLATTIGLGALVRAADTLAPYETTTAISLYERAREMARPDEQLAILLRQARARRLAAEWDAAERDLRAAAELAQTLGDVVAEAEATLLMAHMSWDPVRWNGTLAERLDSLLARVPADEVTVRARLQACLAGGTYEDGATGAGPESTTLARAAAAAVEQLEAGDAAEVLMWVRKGLLDVEPPDYTLQMAVRMRQLARGSSYLTGNAILASLVDRIRLGDDERARRDSSAYRALAGATGSPVHGYIAATLDALWSLHDGQFDDAVEAISAAERLGREFGGTTARQVVAAQRVVLARERGVMTPQLIAQIDADRPVDGRIPLWNIAIAWLQADCGLWDPAGDRLRPIAARTDDFRAIPRGPHRIAALAFAAETLFRLERAGCASADDRRTARCLSTLLAAHQDRQVLVGWPVAHLGPTRRYVGLGAVVGGDITCGLHHLHGALRQSASAPHRARILVDIAAVLETVRPAVSRRVLDEGRRLADRIGMRALVNG